MINLISDTVTKPSAEMLEQMMQAKVGDDVFREDPTINELEKKAAELFGMEAGIFCPSGTMTNQIALKVHTNRLEEVICDKLSHIYQYETGGYAANAGIGIKLIEGENGKIKAGQVDASINPDYDWLPKSSLVVLENTCNKGGGCFYTLDEIKPISKLCEEKGLKIHLDGARIFNALVETGEDTGDIGACFDSISFCLSKGLGAPVGSVLVGSKEFVQTSRRTRKAMGGGMRQAGFLAAAGLYALENNIDRLKQDHARAKTIASVLGEMSFVSNLMPVETNIIIFDVEDPYDSKSFVEKLKGEGILASMFGPKTIRFVTHLDFTDEMLDKTIAVLRKA